MNNKRTWIEKLSDFISGKGFYLVVLICVAAIALSGYYLVQGMRGSLDSALDQPVTGSAAIRETPSASPTPKPSTKPAAPTPPGNPPPPQNTPPPHPLPLHPLPSPTHRPPTRAWGDLEGGGDFIRGK